MNSDLPQLNYIGFGKWMPRVYINIVRAQTQSPKSARHARPTADFARLRTTVS